MGGNGHRRLAKSFFIFGHLKVALLYSTMLTLRELLFDFGMHSMASLKLEGWSKSMCAVLYFDQNVQEHWLRNIVHGGEGADLSRAMGRGPFCNN